MFKKEEYQSPAIEVVGIESESQIMAGSVPGSENIGYGGSSDDMEDEDIWAE